jgi:hypothetical protein
MSTTLRHNRSVGEPQSVIPATSPANGEHLSIVNFLYNEDYPVLTRPQTPEQYPQPTGTGTQPAAIDVELQLTASNTKNGRAHPNHHSMPSEASQGFQAERQNTNSKSSHTHHSHSKPSTNVPLTSLECLSGRERKIQIEQECIRLYFSNLHLVHPILQKKSFLDRCESEVWSVSLASADKLPHKRHRSRFLALYNAVCAVGAITAGDETALGDTSINPLDSSYPSYSNDTRSKRRDKVTYLPVTLARVFLEQAKQNLGDVFEICSMDSTQALFLMVP